MLSLSFLNPTVNTLNTVNNININQKNTKVVSIQSDRLIQNNLYAPTDSFKYYLDYSLVEKNNFDLNKEIARIKEEEKRAEEERLRRIEEEKKAEEERLRKIEEPRKASIKKQQAIKPVSNSTPKITFSGNIPDRITYWANQYGVDANKAIRIAQCESGLNPLAKSQNGLYAGLYQQSLEYWPSRAESVGLPGASIFDAEANIKVSIYMMAKDGFFHWPACSNK
jgi:hypothetical protein